ncbi:MAG: hypothetical protein MJE68_33315 [Proteobacteria bacterium]|nr:hypothetical protein [Pseudomonadota bacterium]
MSTCKTIILLYIYAIDPIPPPPLAPSCRYKWLPSESQRMSGFGTAPASRRQNDQGRGRGGHDWGQGQRLGD